MTALNSLQAHIAALTSALQSADILLTTGGISTGPSDLLMPVIQQQLGGTIHFGRVSMKPGKPTMFATIPGEGWRDDQGKRKGKGREGDAATKEIPVFALPGSPASVLVAFYILVLPALRRLGGWSVDHCQLPRIQVEVRATFYIQV